MAVSGLESKVTVVAEVRFVAVGLTPSRVVYTMQESTYPRKIPLHFFVQFVNFSCAASLVSLIQDHIQDLIADYREHQNGALR